MVSKFCVLLGVFTLLVSAAVAAPVASSVVAQQRADTDLVDLSYNLTGAGATGATIAVELSDDSGATYQVSAPSLSGDLGSGIPDGTNKQIVWDAGVDRPDFVSETMRFRLIVSELQFPVPADADKFALIPAGSFTMGDALDGLLDAPQHAVSVSGFYMGKHEVSLSLWEEVRAWAVSNGYSDLSGVGSGRLYTHPVQNVSWYDVVKWCNAASELANLEPVYYDSQGGAVFKAGTSTPYIDYSKQGYRLPTEAEWEKAARGGLIGKRFAWGDTISHAEANYKTNRSGWSYDFSSHNSDDTYHPDYYEGTAPYTAQVGSFAANGSGLYDMIGNVQEWCNDLYDGNYYNNSPSADPAGPLSGSNRAQRGGSWDTGAYHCRVAYRSYGYPPSRNNGNGFRLVLSQIVP